MILFLISSLLVGSLVVNNTYNYPDFSNSYNKAVVEKYQEEIRKELQIEVDKIEIADKTLVSTYTDNKKEIESKLGNEKELYNLLFKRTQLKENLKENIKVTLEKQEQERLEKERLEKERLERERQEKLKQQELARQRESQKPQQTKPVVKESPKKENTSDKKVYNTVCFQGDCKYAGTSLGHMIYYGNVESVMPIQRRVQRKVDSGVVAIAEYNLNNMDGELTWVYGHNPGVFSSWNRKGFHNEGNVFTVYDVNGNKRDYVVSKVRWALRSTSNTPRDVVGNTGTETVIIQYCIGKYLMYAIGKPL